MKTLIALLALCLSLTWCSACDDIFECGHHEQCCHGTCIDFEATCISPGAIAGIVIGCLIVGGTVLGICLCFCCACGPFQSRNQGAVIQYGGQTATTTTGTSSYPPAPTTYTYGATYPQQGPANYPVQGQVQYPQPGIAPNAGLVQAPPGTVYPPPMAMAPPPSYDEANVPPAYNPSYPAK